MKRLLSIGILLLCLAVACNRQVSEPAEGPSPELTAIDSLMWQQPDSALTVLMDYLSDDKDTACQVSTNETFDNHYAQLLASELLYKNDYAQTNRTELQQAVAYFDSLVREAGGFKTPRNRNGQLVFLAARAHYINGVGYYENDSVVEACTEYIKALETMEGNFEEKELVGNKAKFMALTNNRLLELFSNHFMQESAIVCAKQSLTYNKIEPLSPYSTANCLSKTGLQFDKIREIDSALFYYNKALDALPDKNNLIYRDIVSSLALLAYNSEHDSETALDSLKSIAAQATDEVERMTRYSAIGDIYYEERQYDSAIVYLTSVYKKSNQILLQRQAAEYLHDIYKNHRKTDKADEFALPHSESISAIPESQAQVSLLNDLFKVYLNQKQEKKAIAERQKAVRKAIYVIVPIAIMSVLVILIWAKRRERILSKKQLAETDRALEEADKQHEQAMETILEAHRIEQAALSGRLKRSNQKLRDLKEQIKQQNGSANLEQAASFVEEPICRLILERVHKGQFLSQMDCTIYRDFALDKNQLAALRNAADCHFHQFTVRISKAHPELTHGDLDYCCLYLLGLTDADVAALMQRAYNTVNERNSKLRRIFDSKSPISITLQAIANESALV